MSRGLIYPKFKLSTRFEVVDPPEVFSALSFFSGTTALNTNLKTTVFVVIENDFLFLSCTLLKWKYPHILDPETEIVNTENYFPVHTGKKNFPAPRGFLKYICEKTYINMFWLSADRILAFIGLHEFEIIRLHPYFERLRFLGNRQRWHR